MKRPISILFMMILMLGVKDKASADLIYRGSGLIYDTDRNITWLQDANYALTSGDFTNGNITWDEAMFWALNLEYFDSERGIKWDDWRLPTALNEDGTGPDGHMQNELGHLYYDELENPMGGALLNTGPFVNVQWNYYWTSTESHSGSAYAFAFNSGILNTDSKTHNYPVWAVRDGDVVPIPGPTTLLLLGSGLIGLTIYRGKIFLLPKGMRKGR